MSRIKVTTDPVFGSKCASCGRSADGTTEFYDLGTFEEFWGALVLCDPCVIELCHLKKFVHESEVESRNDQIRNLVVRQREVVEENETLRNAINVLNNLPRDLIGGPVDELSAEELVDSGESESVGTEQGSSESDSSGGSESVSSTTGTDFFS